MIAPHKIIMPNPNLPLKAKFAKEIGTRISLRRFWDDNAETTHGKKYGYHNCHTYLEDKIHPLILGDREHMGGYPEDYPEDMWPKICEECGAICPSNAKKQVFNERLYDTPSGKPEPGSLWYAHWMPENLYWSNKQDYNLYAMVPTGEHWNIDSRAKNCGSQEDRLHRCWTRKGNPETELVDVSKNHGPSCSAGAGSIATDRWHGFLRNGVFQLNG